MGAFCVFGVSRQILRKSAEKTVPTFVAGTYLSAAEWGSQVAAEVDRLFAESDKQVRISPELDAPQFCAAWIAAQPDQVKLTKIMCRGPKVDKHGAVVMRLGQPAMTWVDYDPEAAVRVPDHPAQFPCVSQFDGRESA